MFRTIGDQPSSWELRLPPELLRLPEELARVDALLDDPVFFAPFAPYFHPVPVRPAAPVECYLRLMFGKFRYRLGYESLCAEVSDSISWRRFCRIGLDGRVPHPTTLMKLTTRCGEVAVAGLNEALWAKAAGARLLRTGRVRADTTVISADVGRYGLAHAPGEHTRPPSSGRPARACRASRTAVRLDRARRAGRGCRAVALAGRDAPRQPAQLGPPVAEQPARALIQPASALAISVAQPGSVAQPAGHDTDAGQPGELTRA